MRLVLSTHNAMTVSTGRDDKLPDMGALEALGYFLCPVESLDVLYTNPYVADANHALGEVASTGRYDVVVSGPDNFPVPGQGVRAPIGPVVRNGRQDVVGSSSGRTRGSVVVLRDGTVVMGRSNGATLLDLERRFGQPANPLVSALGGGAILIENGNKVLESDLVGRQMFVGSSVGFRAASMQEGSHIIMGVRKGRAYAAWCTRKSGRDIQGDFQRFGFGSLIKFAYGSGVFFDDQTRRVDGQSPAGFGIRKAR